MDLPELMRHQDGVLARSQVLAHGLSDADIERRIRRRDWARVFDGVYVDHTGPLSWPQKAWGAVLFHHPAALSGASALRAAGIRVPCPSDGIQLVVSDSRRVADPVGVHTSRVRGFEDLVQPHLSPPRMRIEPAALLLASRSRTEDAAVALLGDICQQRRTTPARLLTALAGLPRLPQRRLLRLILDDVATGSYSALERRYLIQVERRHGLPSGSRQRRVRPGRALYYRDVEYLGRHFVVELDGRLGHERPGDRWADFDRDLMSLLLGDLTVRVGWGHVLEPCRLAESVGRLLVTRGWAGAPTPCGSDCRIDDEGDSPAPGAGESPPSRSRSALSPCAW